MKQTHATKFDEVLKKDNRLKVVDFYAEWCGPCKQFMPILQEVSEDFGEVDFFTLNIEGENANMPKLYGVKSVPTMILFYNGEEVGRSGRLDKNDLRELIQNALS